MRGIIRLVVLFCVVTFVGACATTQQKELADIVADGCKAEIDSHCKNVTPGEGRVIACLYAHEDKLSNRCEYAIYEAANQLQRAVNALTYAANECRDDLKTYCSDIAPGEGRLMQCLDKNKDKISARCKQAQKDVGLK
jgi:Cysteine rich repeat